MSVASASTTSTAFYVVSGTLPLTSPSYVTRQADHALLAALLGGEYCFVLNSRQMGKSSLCVRTMATLQEAGVKTVFVDLTRFGGSSITPEQWYIGLLSETGRALGLRREFLAYWKEHSEYSPLQRYFGALHDVGLAQIEAPLVLFIDEIDAVKSLSFSTDEFFAAIRECYNRRVQEAAYGRLSFALVGSATVSELIQDARTTPFNIGTRIELADFTASEVLALAAGIDRAAAPRLVQRVYHWTQGHPFLTQAVCAEIVAETRVRTSADVDGLVSGMFLEAKARERNVNLADVSNRILSSYQDPGQKAEHRAAILDLYRQVWRGRRKVLDDESDRLASVLKLSGITRSVNGALAVRNRIYRRVFDGAWIAASLPDAEARRQRAAYRAGLLRAAGLSSLIIAALLTLSGYALLQRHRAIANAALANKNANRADARTREAQGLTRDLTGALRQSRDNAALANKNALAYQQAAALATSTARQRDTALNVALARKRLADRSVAAERKAARAALLSERRAITARGLATRQAEAADRFLYIANMNLAQQAWEATPIQVGRVKQLLTETHNYRRRGFEWYYWNRLCHLDLKTLTGHASVVTSVAFSPDGERIITGSWDRTAKVWEVRTGRELLTLKGHTAEITSVAFSPDGERIVTGSFDGTAKVWEARTGRELLTLKGHAREVFSVAFSPDGQRIVTGSDDDTARVWEARTGRELLTLTGHSSLVYSVAFSPDGQRIVTGSGDNTAKVWEARTGRELLTLKGHAREVYSVAFSPDGERIVTGSFDGTAKVWETRTGEESLTLKGHARGVFSVAFSPDGERIVTGSFDGTAKVWAARTGEESLTLKGHAREVYSVAFSPDGERLVTGSADKTAKVWEARTGRPLLTLTGHTSLVTSVAFSPDGERLVTGSADKTAKVWEARTGRLLLTLQGHAAEITSVAFSPDGERLVTGSADKTAKVWEARTGRPLLTLQGHTREVYSVAFSPDGERIISGSFDKTTKVWEARTGRLLLTLQGYTDIVTSVAFSPDGHRIVTGSGDHTAIVYYGQ